MAILGMAVPIVALLITYRMWQGEKDETARLEKALREATAANQAMIRQREIERKEWARIREILRVAQGNKTALEGALADARARVHELERGSDDCQKSLDAAMCPDVYGVLQGIGREGSRDPEDVPTGGADGNHGTPGPFWPDHAGRD